MGNRKYSNEQIKKWSEMQKAGKTYFEIAQEEGVPQGSVNSLVWQMREGELPTREEEVEKEDEDNTDIIKQGFKTLEDSVARYINLELDKVREDLEETSKLREAVEKFREANKDWEEERLSLERELHSYKERCNKLERQVSTLQERLKGAEGNEGTVWNKAIKKLNHGTN